MQLSTQLFDRIVGISTHQETQRKATVLPVGCKKAPERRQAARIAFGQRTLICRDSGPMAGQWETVMLQDISQRGIGMLCDEAMPPNLTFMLKLTDKEGDTIRIRCAVRRCERGGFGGTAFLVGAEFQQVIVHQPLRVTNEDGEDATSDDGISIEQIPAANDSIDLVSDKRRGSAISRAAACFLKAVDPLSWMRKADDFSSVG